MNKSILRDSDAFVTAIEGHLKMAETLQQSLDDNYHAGDLGALHKKSGEKGIFMPGGGLTRAGKKYDPPHKLIVDLNKKHSKGLATLINKS